MMSTGATHELLEIGVISPEPKPTEGLSVGEVGYLITGVKDVRQSRVGDTITEASRPCAAPLPGFQPVKPMVFAGIFPTDSARYTDLRDALDKLRLNDASLVYEPETSVALGFGFRCGFLGLLHMEIVQERLRREYQIDLIATTPSVEFRVMLESGEILVVDNPSQMPPAQMIAIVEEPYVLAHVLTPSEYMGNIMKLCQDRRGIFVSMDYLEEKRVRIAYRLPLAEIVLDFYDRLKSASRGYASLDYEYDGYREGDMVKIDILLNSETVDALSAIVHKDKAYEWGRDLCAKLKELIHKQMFQVAIQAAIGSKIIARETLGAMRKNVTAKCYGGDITRKRKLLEKQKEGKRRMKQIGTVEIPQEAFLAVLKVER